MIRLNRNIEGSILDIGGGGDGVISCMYGASVVAIDLREEELSEMNPMFLSRKMVMDASSLSFVDASFDNVTAFYSFMFIEKKKHVPTISEAYRVLRPGGFLHIWDAIIPATEDVAIVEVEVDAGGCVFTPTYGIGKEDPFQDPLSIRVLCEAAGFQLVSESVEGIHFHQVFKKV